MAVIEDLPRSRGRVSADCVTRAVRRIDLSALLRSRECTLDAGVDVVGAGL
jgi:hypothetical protein